MTRPGLFQAEGGSKKVGMPTIADVIGQALRRHPDKIAFTTLEESLLDSFRSNERRPAAVLLGVPDEVIVNIQGDAARRYHFFLIGVPPEVWEESKSPIVVPR
jgi:hypothetical protein